MTGNEVALAAIALAATAVGAVIWLAKYLANELSKDLKEHTQAAVRQQEASKIQADASRESAKASREMVIFMKKLNGKLPHLVEDRKAKRLMEDKK